ncbi:GNAT family N-acetyltransferase [Nocardioides dongxiaopingii]|uniref:GNAT family N-acetyltransferase n=1 Tax=Nocardioides dongxiaopingii TaxID=2576036 RepID=UPI0010C76919|nr:GNAT family N-acetyltransferase [Nocardioides dongxiaopingii]
MRVVQPSAAQLASAATMAVAAETSLPAGEIVAEIEAGRIRPEWSVVAVDESDAVVGRALWWGRDPAVPIALDVWDVQAQVRDRGVLAETLLAAGHEVLSSRGMAVPLPHTVRLPNDWRDRAAVAAEVDLKTRAAAGAGLTRVNERLQFQWDSGRVLPTVRGSLVFAPADDETFLRLFAAAAEGSLDVMTRRELEAVSADELARAELDYYRDCPGERSWWHTAATTDGTVVGLAIPSATPTNRNVGYLAVLPGQRGRGFVDEILTFITRFHAEQGAPRITATTDVANAPMAAAFRRAGYRCTETRLDLEPA